MVSLPPPTLPPSVLPALPAAPPPPPVVVPAQVVAANLQSQLLRELTVPVQSVTVTQAPLPAQTTQPQPAPSTAQQILNAAPPAPAATPAAQPAPAPAQLLLQIQTPQGSVQIQIPAALPPPPAQPGLPQQPVPATLTAPQWQQLVDQGHVQLQIAPMPASLLQRLPPGTPPLLAQLVIPPRDLARLLGTPATAPQAQAPSGLLPATNIPNSFTATVLPPALAESYKARYATTTEQAPQATQATEAKPNALQNAVTSVRNWFDAIRPTATPTPQQAPSRIAPSLTVPQPASEPAPASTTQAPAPAQTAPVTTSSGPLKQVTITLVAPSAPQPQAAPSQPQPAAPQANDTPARLLGVTPSGEKLVETGDGQVLLAPAALPLTPGKPATLRIASPLEANVTLQREAAPTLAGTQPALHETLDALGAAAPALAARLAAQVLLQPAAPPGNLAPSLLFLMAAVGINPAPAAPGKPNAAPALSPALREALDGIDSARPLPPGVTPPPPLAERLLSELRQLGTGREVLDDTGQPWRAFTLPTLTDDTVQTPVNFYLQQQQPRLPDQYNRESNAAPAGTVKQTRFIVDMQLSRLGTTQLEGLSRARQLDLTLRTHQPLPPELQAELTARYTEIASATGLTGTLQFGAGKWFTARETASASHMNARL